MNSVISYIWGILGKTGPQLLFLLTNLVLARYLSPSDFGQVAVLGIFISIASTLNEAGLGGSLINQKNYDELDCSTISVYNITISVALYVILFLSSSYIEIYFSSPGLADVIKLIFLMLIFNALGMVPRTLLVRDLRFKELAIINVVSVFIGCVVSIVCAVSGLGVNALILYYLVSAAVSSIIVIVIKRYKIRFKFSFDRLKKLMPFGIFTTLSNIIDAAYENSLSFFVGRYYTVYQAGLLSQAKKLEDATSLSLGQTLSYVAFPILSRVDSKENFIIEYKKLLCGVCLLVFPIFMTISLYSTEIISILFGEKWIDSSTYLSVLMFAALFIISDTLYRNFIKAHGDVKYLFNATIIKRIIGVLLIVAGALFLSLDWILIFYVVGCLIGLLINVIVLCKVLKSNVLTEFYFNIKLLLPSLGYYIVSVILFSFVEHPALKVGMTCVLIGMVYYLADMVWNINFLKIAVGLLRKH